MKKPSPQKLVENIDESSLPISIQEFQNTLDHWQANHGRHDLPWQQHPSPYRVLVSEVMLQQTQVKTVIPYFNRWMTRFPEISDLAQASEDEVMQLWQGLGYYSRARNLRKAAIYIEEECQGRFPQSLEALLKIPGVGRYTAGAIAAFAYDSYGPIVDGNVKRLFCRLFGIEGVPGTSKVDNHLWRLAHYYTPKPLENVQQNQLQEPLANPISNRRFAQGLLDMGATLCKPKNPNCQRCHFQNVCIAFKTNKVDELPTPKPKKQIPTKDGHFLWIEKKGAILLEKRDPNGIWGSLWCLPQIYIETKALENIAALKGQFKHTFTHYKLEANVWSIESINQDTNTQKWFTFSEVFELGLPTPIKKFLAKSVQYKIN